jgi:hypothetical protein
VKIIFLDVDGVLNIYSKSYITYAYKKDKSVEYVEPFLLKRLEWILKETSAKIVISSSWRLTMDDLQNVFEAAGFEMWDEVIGRTSISKFRYRGEEIMDWLDHHKDVEKYVVLEDEIDDVCGEKCNNIPKENVVEVDMRNGLTHQDVQNTIEILL